MKGYLNTAAAMLLFGGSALAQGVSPGAEQIARSIGVDAADFTLAELVQLNSAREDGDRALERAILSRVRGATVSTMSAPPPARVSLAAKLKVRPSEMSFGEMMVLQAARSSGAPGPEAAFWSNRNPANPSRNPGHVSRGEAQIAAALGVDPADYTLAELTAMSSKVGGNE